MTSPSDLNSIVADLKQGRNKAALKSAKAGMRQNASHPAYPNFAAIALCATGKPREAIPYFQKAINLDPGFHDARKNLGIALIELRQFEKAIRVLERVTTDNPQDGSAWEALALARLDVDALEDAEQAAGIAISLAPRRAQALGLRGDIRVGLRRLNEAIGDYRRMIEVAQADPETLVKISDLMAQQSDHTGSLDAARRAVEISPAHFGALRRLGEQLMAAGDIPGAVEIYRRILELAPGDADAIEKLAGLQTPAEIETLRPMAETALRNAPHGTEVRASLHFALGEMARKSGDDDAASSHLAKANAEIAAIAPYDAKSEAALTDRLIDVLNGALPKADQTTDTGPRPIYVIGLPRSGTTLTEAILGAHPRVKALGERTSLERLIRPIRDKEIPVTEEFLATFRAEDRRLLPEMPDETLAYVDSMPHNHRIVGLLKSVYPDALVINLRRDPRDIALSMWRAHFRLDTHSYASDFKDMAHQFNLYARLMRHWHALYPGQILDLSYEETVTDIDGASRKLAAHCGLDWVPDMTHPEEHVSQVRTLSVQQIRQAVHSRSVGQWKTSTDLLAPLIEGLDPALWPEIA